VVCGGQANEACLHNKRRTGQPVRRLFFRRAARIEVREPNPLNALHAKNAWRRSRNKLRNMNAGETRLAVKTFTTPA
jgi:hypothetical protein